MKVKAIRSLLHPTKGLDDYLNHEDSKPTWEKLRDYEMGSAYRELRDVLVDIQHKLCAYCEIDLTELDVQVEHVISKDDSHGGSSHELDPTNLIACCKGGTATNLYGPDVREPDEERFLPPAGGNISCGQAKGNVYKPDFIDPRRLPLLPSLFRVRDNGTIQVDEEAAGNVGVSVSHLNQTIENLGLNVRRLRRARENHWEALSAVWASYIDDLAIMEQAARVELLPNDGGDLKKLFTTSRSYFGSLSDRILAEDPQSWV